MLFEISNRRGAGTQVEVQISRDATAPDEQGVDDKPGVIVWRKDLQPGETWRITHTYDVSYPADKRIIRRDG